MEPPDDTPTPMIVDPVPPPGKVLCPQCGTVFRSSNEHQKDGDYGVCHTCFHTIIHEAGSWRLPTYDEAYLADQDARVRILKAAFRAPAPESSDT